MELLAYRSNLAHPHVIEHALTQWADARLLGFHGLLLLDIEAKLPRVQHRQLAAGAKPPPSQNLRLRFSATPTARAV